MSENRRYRLVWGDEEFDLPTGEVTLGRSRSCDVSVAEPSVSRKHVFLSIDDDEVVLQDLGSSNGTFVDGGRVRGTARLTDGSELRMGDARLRLEIVQDEPGAAPAPSGSPAGGPSVAANAPPLGRVPIEGPENEVPATEIETSKLRDARSETGPLAAAAEPPDSPGHGEVAGEAPDDDGELLPSIDDLDGETASPATSLPRPEQGKEPRRAVEPTRDAAPAKGSVMVAADAARPTWKIVVAAAGSMFLGAILLVAAWTKMIDPASFARQIQTEGLDVLLPASRVALIAVGLEVFLGVLLILAVRRLPVLLASTGLVLFFLYLTGRTWWLAEQGELPSDVGCGCFGNLVQRTPAEAFWQDLALLVPALLLAWWARPRTAGFPKWRTVFAVLATGAAVTFATMAPELPLDDLATRLRPGKAIAELCAGSEATRTCLDGVVPELLEGEHLVVLAELDDALTESVPILDDYHLSGADPPLIVLAAVTPEELFAFQFGQGAAFEIHEAPAPLLRPLYRTLPRSFRVVDGVVVETWTGLPPLLEPDA